MKFIQVNSKTIINADHIVRISIDKPKPGMVTLYMAKDFSYNNVELNWLEWADLKPQLGLCEIIDAKVVE